MSATRRSLVGILGGCFGPPHDGHLELARQALERLALRRVVFMIAARPPHKAAARMSPLADRLAMLEAAIEGVAGCEIGRLEIERTGTGYTIDTLRFARERYGGTPVFLAGLDSLVDLPRWRDWRALVDEFDLAVARRPGVASDLDRLPDELARRVVELGEDDGPPTTLGDGGRVFVLPVAPPDVASRAIRARRRRGEPIDALVPAGVARYISRQMLYSEKPSGAGTLPEELAECIAASRERRAGDLQVLDLRGLSDVTDYFVICHGTTERQVKAIAETIEERMRSRLSVKPKHVEGRARGEWILLDYIDLVVHVFLEDKRRFYRIERLWGDAPRVELPPDPLADPDIPNRE